MNHLKLRTICILSIMLFIGAQVSFSKDLGDTAMPDRYIAERALASLKVKLADNFSVGAWGALYYGAQYFPYRNKIDPFEYNGFDVVPGFDCGLGTMFGKVKVNAGGDLYLQARFIRGGGTAKVTEPTKYEFRPRGNLGFTAPILGTGALQWIHRLERQIQNQRNANVASYFRYRSTLKLSGPKFTSFKINPYALYEGFNAVGKDNYYLEAEFGINFTPIKNMGVSFSDLICTVPERNNFETHQFCVYIFYTIDASKGFSNFIRSIKSVD